MIALAGWVCAAVLAVGFFAARRRLERVRCAEHELRGPLTALTLGVESLARDPRAYARAEPLAAELTRVRAGLSLLGGARGDERTEALRIVRGLARSWDAVARRDGRAVRLRWRAGGGQPLVDGGRLAQALGNALSNAVEHGEGHVEVLATRRDDALRLEVQNRGVAARRGAGRGLGIATRAARDAGGSFALMRGEGRTGVAIELPLREQ